MELPIVIPTVVDVNIAARRQLLSHVPPMNDIGQRRSWGGADEMFNGANAVAAAHNKVPVSSSFEITPHMATAVIVISSFLPPSQTVAVVILVLLLPPKRQFRNAKLA